MARPLVLLLTSGLVAAEMGHVARQATSQIPSIETTRLPDTTTSEEASTTEPPETTSSESTPTEATTPQTSESTSEQQQPTQQTETSAQQPPDTTAPLEPSVVFSTDSAGLETVVTVTTQPPSLTTSLDSTPTESDPAPKSNGIGTGPIIGMSVAGGIALLAIIGFFVWKFTRKRFTDFDDNEAIKWPELNSHAPGDPAADTHALPVHNTGRAGFGDENDMDSRAPSVAGNYSTTDFSHDPYQVAPMPAYNPNVPYRDDPSASGAMYDPYRGPVPQSLGDTAPHGEAIPMTQMRSVSPGPGRALSPNPGPMYATPYDANSYGPERAISPGNGGYR